MKALYVCYQGVDDPLTQTQVVAYLEGLATAGHKIALLTFEPISVPRQAMADFRQRLLMKGIEWRWLRYHKRPSLPATAWDVFVGILYVLFFARLGKLDLLHARSHVPGALCLVLKRITGAKLLFDFRGLLAEEYVDAGVWRQNGHLFRLTKWFERRIIRESDGIIVLTHRARNLLTQSYEKELSVKNIIVIPCCVHRLQAAQTETRPEHPLRLAYVGKLGGWYLTEAMLRFFAIFSQKVPGTTFEIWTQSDRNVIKGLLYKYGISENTFVGYCPPDKLLRHLSSNCDAAVSFIRPSKSKIASSPTKIPEYLAAGLPVVFNHGIGDLNELIADEGVGVCVTGFSDDAFDSAVRQLVCLMKQRDLGARCRKTAEKFFDLERVGWAGYRRIYELLARS